MQWFCETFTARCPLRPLTEQQWDAVGRKASVTEQSSNDLTTASLFAVVWNALTDLMGSSATATLVRRAAKHAAAKRPALNVLVIHRPVFDYEYVVPEPWRDDGNGMEDLSELVRALVPLLTELTGTIAVQRLRSFPELLQSGLLHDDASGEDSMEGKKS